MDETDFERRYPLDDATWKRIFQPRGIRKEVAEARPHVPYAQGDPGGLIQEWAGWGEEQAAWLRMITKHSGGIIMVRNPALPATAPKTGRFWDDEEAGWGTHGAPIPAEIRPDEPVATNYARPHHHPPVWPAPSGWRCQLDTCKDPKCGMRSWVREHLGKYLNTPPEEAPKKLKGLREGLLTEREQYDLSHESPEEDHQHVDPAKYIHPTDHFPEYNYPGWIPPRAFTEDVPRYRSRVAAWREHLAKEFPGKTFTLKQEWKRWHEGWKLWLERNGYAEKFRYTATIRGLEDFYTPGGHDDPGNKYEVVTASPKTPPWVKALGPRGRVIHGQWEATRELTKQEKFYTNRYIRWVSWAQSRQRYADTFPHARRLDMHPSKRARQLFEEACSGGILFFVLESCLKADAVLSAGYAAVSVPAVGQWHAPELELFAEKVKGAAWVIVLSDSDWGKTIEVHRAATDCVEWFRAHGVNAIHGAPPALPELPKTGIDDWLNLTAVPRRSLLDIDFPVRDTDEQESRDTVYKALAELEERDKPLKAERARIRKSYPKKQAEKLIRETCPTSGVNKNDVVRAHWWFVLQLRGDGLGVGVSYSAERLAKFMTGKVRVNTAELKRAQRARRTLEGLGLIRLVQEQTFSHEGASIAPVYEVYGFAYSLHTVSLHQLREAL